MTVSLTQFGCSTPPQFGACSKSAPQFGHAPSTTTFFSGGTDTDGTGGGDSANFSQSPKPGKKGLLSRFWDKHPGLYVKLANITNHPAWSAFP